MKKFVAQNMLRNIDIAMRQDQMTAKFIRAIEGPQAVSFFFQLPVGKKAQSMAKSTAFQASLTSVLSRDVVVNLGRSGLVIEVSKLPENIKTPTSDALIKFTEKGTNLCLGIDVKRRPAIVDINKLGHILLIGPTGRGKTEAAKSYLYLLANSMMDHKMQFLIVARKSQVWKSFERSRFLLGGNVVTNETEMRDAISYVHNVMNIRSSNGNSNLPHIILVLDDLINLSSVIPYKKVEEIASMGIASNIYLWVSTQTDGKNGGLTQPISANMRVRIVFGGTNAGDASRFAGRGQIGADVVGKTPGDAMSIIDGVPTRIVTPFAGDVAQKLPRLFPNDRQKPWQRSGVRRGEAGDTPFEKTAFSPPYATSFDGFGGFDSSFEMEMTEGSDALDDPIFDQPRGMNLLPISPDNFDVNDPEQVAIVKDVYAWVASINKGKPSLTKTTRLVFGSKNGRTFHLVKQCLHPQNGKKEKEKEHEWINQSPVRFSYSS